MVQVAVDAATAPFLVTSTRGLVWLSARSVGMDGNLRAGIRLDELTKETLFNQIVEAIVGQSREAEWGSVQPLSTAGVRSAMEYLRSFDLNEVEVLRHPKCKVPLKSIKEVVECDWVGPDRVLVVPKDRAFLGTYAQVGQAFFVVVHNPARGIAVCQTG